MPNPVLSRVKEIQRRGYLVQDITEEDIEPGAVLVRIRVLDSLEETLPLQASREEIRGFIKETYRHIRNDSRGMRLHIETQLNKKLHQLDYVQVGVSEQLWRMLDRPIQSNFGVPIIVDPRLKGWRFTIAGEVFSIDGPPSIDEEVEGD
jgi:hypothetical protein